MDIQLNQLNVGDTFVMGSYAPEGRGKKLPITWQILKKEERRMLVLSQKILDCQPFHRINPPVRWKDSKTISEYLKGVDGVAVRWEDCELRQWLNTDFLNAAFTPEEQQVICQPESLNDPEGEFLWKMFGMETATCAISDRIFLLSHADLDEFFPTPVGEEGVFPGSEAEGTAYVREMFHNDAMLSWMLRSSLPKHPAVLIVSSVGTTGITILAEDGLLGQGVRPAMWVKI